MFRINFMACCVFSVLLCASFCNAADRTVEDARGNSIVLQATESPDFFHYANERFGFAVDVPAMYTLALVIPDNGDGIILTDANKETQFRASGGNIIEKRSLKQRYDADRKTLGKNLAYSHLGKNFYILSWVEDSMIHYRKYILAPSVYCDMEFTYPAARKKEFDVPVTHSARSLSLEE